MEVFWSRPCLSPPYQSLPLKPGSDVASSNPGTSYNSILLWIFTVGVLMSSRLLAFIALAGDGIIAQHDRIRRYPCVHLRRPSLPGAGGGRRPADELLDWHANFFFFSPCRNVLLWPFDVRIDPTHWVAISPQKQTYIIGIGFQWCFFNVLGMLCSKYKSIHAYRHNMDALVLTGHLRMAER